MPLYRELTTNIDLSFYSDFLDDSLKNDSIVISENNPTNKNPLINIGINVFNDINKIIGTLILEIAHERIDEIIFENNKHNGLGETGEVYLVGDNTLNT